MSLTALRSTIALTLLAAASAGSLGFGPCSAQAQSTKPDAADRSGARREPPDMQRHMSPKMQARTIDGNIAMIKNAIGLKPEQEQDWSRFEQALREQMKQRLAAEQPPAPSSDPIATIEQKAQALERQSAQLNEFAAAAKPFYQSLDPMQKDTARVLLRQMDGTSDHRLSTDDEVRQPGTRSRNGPNRMGMTPRASNRAGAIARPQLPK